MHHFLSAFNFLLFDIASNHKYSYYAKTTKNDKFNLCSKSKCPYRNGSLCKKSKQTWPRLGTYVVSGSSHCS